MVLLGVFSFFLIQLHPQANSEDVTLHLQVNVFGKRIMSMFTWKLV